MQQKIPHTHCQRRVWTKAELQRTFVSVHLLYLSTGYLSLCLHGFISSHWWIWTNWNKCVNWYLWELTPVRGNSYLYFLFYKVNRQHLSRNVEWFSWQETQKTRVKPLQVYSSAFLSVKTVTQQLLQENGKLCYFPSAPPHTHTLTRLWQKQSDMLIQKLSVRVAWWLHRGSPNRAVTG